MDKPCVCNGERGYYLDSRCLDRVCDHRFRPVTKRNDEGKVTERGPPVMKCPKRPCPCPAGLRYRLELRGRIVEQEATFAAVEPLSYEEL